MTYFVRVDVVTPDYRYWRPLRGPAPERKTEFATRQEAAQAIEAEIANWPAWTEGRKLSFRSHCKIVEVEPQL